MGEIIRVKDLKGQWQHFFRAAAMGLLLGATACASPTARERLDERQSRNQARAAAYAADGFTVDHRSPEPRPYRAWEYYYKHCTLVSRDPYPSRAEYSCTDPF